MTTLCGALFRHDIENRYYQTTKRRVPRRTRPYQISFLMLTVSQSASHLQPLPRPLQRESASQYLRSLL